MGRNNGWLVNKIMVETDYQVIPLKRVTSLRRGVIIRNMRVEAYEILRDFKSDIDVQINFSKSESNLLIFFSSRDLNIRDDFITEFRHAMMVSDLTPPIRNLNVEKM